MNNQLMKKLLGSATGIVAGLALTAVAHAQPSQTAQSAMVATGLGSNAYQIDGTVTWKYDRDAAEAFYTNAWDGNAPVETVGTGAQQFSPGVPDPSAVELMQHAQAQRCIFFCGGPLSSKTYTITVNGTKSWKWEYTFKIVPKVASVAPKTCWSSESGGGGAVDISFAGFVSSESFLKQSNGRTKYSFTLLEPDPLGGLPLSRVINVSAQLQKSDGLGGWVNVGSPIVYGTLPVTPTTANYVYCGNGGVFGNSAVYSYLHAPGRRVATAVNGILVEDNFANNDNDLASGNVHQANYDGVFAGVTEEGNYRILISGTIKGNSAIAGQNFSVASSQTVIGGCNCN
jgi:hypothetical protein